MKEKNITLLCPVWLIQDGEFNNFEVGEYFYFNAIPYEDLPYKDKCQDDKELNYKYDYYIEPYCEENYLICGKIKKIRVLQKDLFHKKYTSLSECADEEDGFINDLLIDLEECEYIEKAKQDNITKEQMKLNLTIIDIFNTFNFELAKKLKKDNFSLTICHPDKEKISKAKQELMQIKSFSRLSCLMYDMTKKEDVEELIKDPYKDIFITTNQDINYQKTKQYILEKIYDTRSEYYDINVKKIYTKITYYITIFVRLKNSKYDYITIKRNYYTLNKKPYKVAKFLKHLIKKNLN